MPLEGVIPAVIVCPLEFERRSLRRAGIPAGWRIECCGPGARGVDRWAAERGGSIPKEAMVILAGLAGGLHPAIAAGNAMVASEVVSSDRSESWKPSMTFSDASYVVTSADHPIATPDDKRRLHERTRADLIDMESASFARQAIARGWRWGIVRGVSDDARMSLPPRIERWVNDRGDSRPAAVAAALLRRPWMLPRVLRLGRMGKLAMSAAAGLIRQLAAETKR